MPQLPPPSAIFDEIINDVALVEKQQILLFLDDYHVITNPRLHEALEHFIEHLPPSIHLAITTREDPPFALARMRARGQMTACARFALYTGRGSTILPSIHGFEA
jgi:LuxR family maltose regulon positive regulatory protein